MISLEDMSYNLGKRIVFEKHRFVGIKDGPSHFYQVGHVIDLRHVPADEKSIVRENILRGARDAENDEGTLFLNDN